MKIKLSKSQWEEIGKKAGWVKTSSENTNLIRYFLRIQTGWENEKSPVYKLENGILYFFGNGRWHMINNTGISDNGLKGMGLKEVSYELVKNEIIK